LRKACDAFKTRESLPDLLIKGLDAWLSSSTLEITDFPPSLHPLILSQTRIGWRQLFQGRFSLEWIKLQDTYLQELGIHRADTTGTLWVTRIITVIWKQFLLMWEERNASVHGHDSATRKIATHKRIATEFRFVHTKRTEVLHTDRELFIGDNTDDVEAFIETTTPKYLENWLQIWRPVILDSAKAAAAFALTSVQPLTNYFDTLRSEPQSKRPPKPRYSKSAHTRHDGTDCVCCQPAPKPPVRNYQITKFFSRRFKLIETRPPLPI
jgi:hypothetical protein